MKLRRWIIALILLLPARAALAEWKVDFSRRIDEVRGEDLRNPASVPAPEQKKDPGFLDFLFAGGEPVQEIVVLNTDKGFVPSTLRVKEGLTYKISVVNVNESARNVSFVLDSFSEHHATYYGKIKTFDIKPVKEGVFSFMCPETSAKGRLVVYPSSNGAPSPEVRLPASEQ
jgi:hypothetical protein